MWWRILWLTTDFWLYSGTNKGKYCWLLVQHPMAMDWIPLHTCVHVHMWARVVWAKYFHKSRQENTSYFPHCCIPDCSDPCSSGPCCSSVSVCDWRSTEKSRQPIYKVGTDTLHHSPRVVQFWHQSLITIFGEGADWLHLLDASKYWQPLWSANPNLNSTCW